ncbi:MAG: hypothetical protein IH628_10670, partial [Proteobacteria bacterium]|nr:hypothetical protein [Pseudomonadota bacterium]
MKKLALLFVVIIAFGPSSMRGQANQVIFDWKQSFQRVFIKSNDRVEPDNFYLWDYTPSRNVVWGPENAPFGTINNTKSPPCPLNYDSKFSQAQWPSGRNLLLRKEISLLPGARNIRVRVAIDNGVKVYWNGVDISGGQKDHNECALEDSPGSLIPAGDMEFTVSQAALNNARNGKHLLAVEGVWLSSKNYLDVQVIGDIAFSLTLNINENLPPPAFNAGMNTVLKDPAPSPDGFYEGGQEVTLTPVIAEGWD